VSGRSSRSSRASAADDQAVVAALGRIACDVADAEGAAGPSPRAWHELVRGRAAPLKQRWPRGWMLVAAGAVGLVVAFGIDRVVRRGGLSAPLTFTVDGGLRGAGGDIQGQGAAGSDVVFSDGTEVQLASNALLRVAPPGPHGASMRLRAGEAHFQVVHRPRAAWFVEAGPYVIEVTGTAFDVRWSETEQVVEVRMRSGAVRVSGPLLSERVMLGRGQRLVARVKAGDLRIDDAHAAAATATGATAIGATATGTTTRPEGAPAAPVVAAGDGLGPATARLASSPTLPPAVAEAPPALPGLQGGEMGVVGRVRRTQLKAPHTLAMRSPGAALDPQGTVAAIATQPPPMQDSALIQPPASVDAAVPLAKAGRSVWVDRQWAAQVAAGDGHSVLADAEALGLDITLKQADSHNLAAFADAARYAGRGELAAQALQEIRRRFPETAQAQMAAFLLGRAADDRGDTRAGLGWYRRYRAEAPAGAYAAEALGREMLAIERLQGPVQAQAIAGEYLRRFPNGTYLLRARALLDNR
jgi:ferric-dicitrate binding protein FerR (iron transport regulator)/TolA-binding protein